MVAVQDLVVEVTTASGGIDGTDDRVFFDVGTRQWQLDNEGSNDFVPGATDTFDLEINSDLDTSDIRRIGLSKSGTNGWQPRWIRVRANGELIYSGTVDIWLDQGAGAEQLAGVLWQATDFPQRFRDRAVVVRNIVVRTTTDTRAAAGTDNRVLFSIGTREWQLNNTNRNDFERGRTDTFTISDIDRLRMHHIRQIGLRKTGRDGWRPSRIRVWVNDEEMLDDPLYDGPIDMWLDGGAGAQLRHGLKWTAADYPQSVPISADAGAPVDALRVRISTGRRRYSQTDDAVYLDVGTREWLLDNIARDDFERGRTDDFDLTVHDGMQRSDIRKIGLRKAGTNGWRPERVRVFLNGSTTPFSDSTAALFLDAGADARNRFGPAWTARNVALEIPVQCWNVIGATTATIGPNRSMTGSAALVDNLNTAAYRTGAGSVNAIWTQAQLTFRVIDFGEVEVDDALAQMMPDVTTQDFDDLADIAGDNNLPDVMNVYFVRTTSTGSNWSVPTRNGNPPSIWVQDTRGGQAVNTNANFRRIVTSLSHEIGHFLGLPHMCDDANADPCTAAEQANLMMGDGTNQTSIQLSLAEVATARGNAVTWAE